MPRNMKRHESHKRAKNLRAYALARNELRLPSEARQSAAGATSAPVKAVDRETADMVEAFLRRRREEAL